MRPFFHLSDCFNHFFLKLRHSPINSIEHAVKIFRGHLERGFVFTIID
ncbi:Uncharacterised protein [Salmonella enterica subsp. enterica serovar Typhi]|nr:Uncharacterised protein [Salmonella enterica subsp. enterica serovar Typhi]CGE36435.1 Uncharacterised protein [Salmonella enterica subsp. enterica serovar Typhi]CHW57690.1 Uncharacterised protein [Salmonella enterica subsp. enterica serovar Typhi]CHY32190.1 Uncharacterised protein [Salmonella enterica subsp. enterica serovar Typhi]CRF89649.1 Uncharacterised protein [Salmonella enterica subsp. enterica serovar Typhi]